MCSVIGVGGSCWAIRFINCVFGDWGRGELLGNKVYELCVR